MIRQNKLALDSLDRQTLDNPGTSGTYSISSGTEVLAECPHRVYLLTTGEGHVPFHKGDYHDALRHKNNQVALLLVECFGGIASGGARLLRYLARRASDKKRGRDGTKYSKFHPRGYLSHHLAAISMAAVYTDAAHIADGVIGLKQRSLAANDPTE